MKTEFKSGFIAVVGKPNVGKSSLINAMVGEKVCIVSPKAQTTRDKLMGILTTRNYQMVFVDTPGIHKPKNMLGEYMENCIKSASADVDVIIVVVDGSKGLHESDMALIERYAKYDTPVVVLVNKVDLLSYEKVYPMLQKLSPLMTDEKKIAEIIPVSARKKSNLEVLKNTLYGLIPQGEMYYPEDEISDKSERYMITEIVREKALYLLHDEVPHGIGVYLQSFTTEGGLVRVAVDIICEKDTHKQIVIGENGSMLKAIGERSRVEIAKMLGKKIFLELFVKVRENWRDNKNTIKELGYDERK